MNVERKHAMMRCHICRSTTTLQTLAPQVTATLELLRVAWAYDSEFTSWPSRESAPPNNPLLQSLPKQTAGLNIIWFPYRNSTGSAIQNKIHSNWDSKKLSRIRYGCPIALITAVKCWTRGFFGYKQDWIKYLDNKTGLGSGWITQWKYWVRERERAYWRKQVYYCCIVAMSHIFCW